MKATALSGELVAKGLRKWYHRRDQAPIHVLEDCSFRIEPGKLTVVMGTSGCGKSTLAYILSGYIKPDEGHILMDGQPVTGPGPERIMVFQETALWPWMTVIENIVFGPLSRSSLSREEATRKALDLLRKFGLSEFKDKYPGQLSGGMKRRAELAQALINSPKLMVLDEPFRGLDVMTRELMQEYYIKLFEETRLTTVFITSELEEAIFLADRILIMGGTPSRIVHSLEVDLPRPRTFEVLATERYLEIKKDALEVLYGESMQHAC
jgi:NitT/TauT family transport system ATP-binding protein